MTDREAAKSLREDLCKFGWLQAVGIGVGRDGKPCLYVYATRKPPPSQVRNEVLTNYHGFGVTLRIVGKVRPAAD